jgi:hypothetical protein
MAQEPPAPRRALNLVTSESVIIERPARAVWPFILDQSAWKTTVKLQHVGGRMNAEGEIFAARVGEVDTPIMFFLQTMELVPLKRRTIKLYNAEGGPLIGFASWELDDLHDKSKVTYRVYAEILASPATTTDNAALLLEQQRRYTSENETRFRAELAALKRLVETR